MNTRDIKVSTVSLSAVAGSYLIRFNGELVSPSTSEEIGNIQRTLRYAVKNEWQRSHDAFELENYLQMMFAPSTSSSPYRIFRRLSIIISHNPTPAVKAGTKRRKRKSKPHKRNRGVI